MELGGQKAKKRGFLCNSKKMSKAGHKFGEIWLATILTMLPEWEDLDSANHWISAKMQHANTEPICANSCWEDKTEEGA